MDLGSIIKSNRKKKGQTQTEFALSCGITQTYLSQIESNQKDPNLSTLKAISQNLAIPLPILFFLSITEDDIDPQKVSSFQSVSSSIKPLIDEFFSTQE